MTPLTVRRTGDPQHPLAIYRGDDPTPVLEMSVVEANDLLYGLTDAIGPVRTYERTKTILGRTFPRHGRH